MALSGSTNQFTNSQLRQLSTLPSQQHKWEIDDCRLFAKNKPCLRGLAWVVTCFVVSWQFLAIAGCHAPTRVNMRSPDASDSVVHEAWSFSKPDYYAYETVSSNGVKVASIVKTRKGKAKLVLLAGDSGQLEWEQQVPDFSCVRPPVMSESIVGAIYQDKSHRFSITAFDIHSGKLIWDTRMPFESPMTLRVSSFTVKNQIIVMSSEGDIASLGQEDGLLRWSSRLPGETSWSTPIIGEKKIVVCWQEQVGQDLPPEERYSVLGLDCLDIQSGELIWRYRSSEKTSPRLLLASDSKRVFCGERRGIREGANATDFQVTCFSIADGTIIWRATLPVVEFLMLNNENLVGIADKTRDSREPQKSLFWTADADTGRLLEMKDGPALAFYLLMPPIIKGDIGIFLAAQNAEDITRTGQLVWVNLKTGKVLAEQKLSSSTLGLWGVASNGNLVYVALGKEMLLALELPEASRTHEYRR
ncbi:MAG: PQQ-binding-like beta-propeller repeat protein [Armatimonadetes bacterium]|nr:PQQ-binding-like beta-propeller repeat protein [candidate division Zixibacteria bacterium]NIO75385.1 PQQ-binding-like beta-propeller repeat protein [Armatimonadota bacterium]